MLLCLSASHRTAAFDLLERLSVSGPSVGPDLVDHTGFVTGAVVVATCNRFEAYLDIDEPLPAARELAAQGAIELIAERTGITAEELRGSTAVHSGPEVAEHLFAVSSGLESVVVGEGEIAGQVRRALDSARVAGTTSPELERLFQRASTASRAVQTNTGVGGAGRSIVRLALDLASSRISDWRDQEILLVGTGKYAGASLAALRDRGVTEVGVFSPSGRAHKFATREGVRAVTRETLADALATATVIVTCSTAETVVLTRDMIEGARSATSAPLFVIDMGLPRNVDPAVGGLPHTELLDLETIRLHAPLEELAATDDARALIGSAAAAYHAESAEQQVTSAVVAYRSRVFDLLDAELERLRARGEATEAAERAMRHLVSVLVHAPTQRAKSLAREGRAAEVTAAFDVLFDLGVKPDADEAGDERYATA
ncbi:glutamyl-tRNA reductase [Herbiconiux sp. L3-i23]|uniref:glutamyl-tRNA reductase n=1 Tax=Herbiconiux sp. L3-i23 TaxID=2905871 RepID=UPI002056AABC|nr:glutamyl-tRNA reductase [Herbiconiux sp. L3-i23]BDI21282.1 glutamyl-tRNA reductase [Herbiconiux sp. L3-i23]